MRDACVILVSLVSLPGLLACQSTPGNHLNTGGNGASSGTIAGSGAGTSSSAASATSGSTVTGATTASSASSSTGSSMTPPTAAQLLALTTHCTQVSNGLYKVNSAAPPTVPICSLNGAYFFTADMDIDCDGQTTPQCNINTDPYYQSQTSATDSMGKPLNAAVLPYVVLPLPSTRFNFGAHGVKAGEIIAVIYNGKLNYGVYGDAGPSADIGEASYAMAKSLGVDPNPSTGGTPGPVTYIVFTGTGAVASPIEDHAATVTSGESLAAKVLQTN